MTARRAITNHLQDCQLLDLGRLLGHEGNRGPFLLVQDGCDPADPKMRECSFVLTRRGTWLHYYLYLALPESIRRRCALFDTSPEVMQLAEGLPGKVQVEDPLSLQEMLREYGFQPNPEDFTGRALLEQLKARHRPA